MLHHRLLRTAIGLATVMVAYSAYALVAVPLIEPPPKQKPAVSSSTPEQRELARVGNRRYRKLFERYFPPEHWAHDNPKVLESEQVMLLIQEYRALPGGRMELTPCVMLFFPKEEQRSEGEPGAVILDAPRGAVLQFDEEFDLAQAKIGRLQHGKLVGEITIYSEMQQPGPEDDLRIATRNIQMTPSRIWTSAAVDFRLGGSTGQGTEMEIRLLPGSGGGGVTGIDVGGLHSFHLAHDVRMHLEMKQQGLLPGEEQPPASSADEPQPPVEISCTGPFHFDLVQYVATFEDKVDVLRLNPNGPSDQMNCELLSIYFQPKPEEGETSPPSERDEVLPRLEPTIIEAHGDPVIVRSPSTLGQARCQRLEYNLLTRKISLEASQRVMLFQGPNQVEARAVHYQPGTRPGDLGTLWAQGPGWLQAQAEEDPSQAFRIEWQRELHLRRYQGTQVVSALGRPRLEATGTGSMTADEVHLWLRDPPPDEAAHDRSPADGVQPDRMLAQGNVKIDSPQLTAATARMEVWFRPSAKRSPANSSATSGPRPLVPVAQNTNSAAPPRVLSVARSGDDPPQQRYAVEGQLVRMQMLLEDRDAKLADLTVDGGVVFRETHTARPDDEPLIIRGDRLQLSGAEDELAHATISGQPAHVEARGMTIEGAAIDLDQQTNRMWIDGAGRMTLPVRQDLQGQPVDSPQRLVVRWQGRMQFDGRVARFEKQIEGQGPAQRMQTELLEAELKEPIRFAASSSSRAKPELHELRCGHGVYFENHPVEDGQPTSIDRMQLASLRINQTTGAITGDGPGWVTTVRTGGSSPLQLGSQPAPRSSASGGKLDYLRVDFSRGIEGNLHRRQIAFVGNVRSVYGPVPDWSQVLDADDPEGLGEQGVLLDCDRLTVTEMQTPLRQQGHLELEALGNTLVEGRTFTARAHRMAYTQAKELLVLEGTGQSDAQLWRQTQIGSPAARAAARKILFWRSTNRVEVDDARYLDLSQFGE